MAREASAERNTKETEIKLKINLDGTGYSDIETGVGFFNHMLDGFTRHGLFDLSVRVHGDLQVDDQQFAVQLVLFGAPRLLVASRTEPELPR